MTEEKKVYVIQKPFEYKLFEGATIQDAEKIIDIKEHAIFGLHNLIGELRDEIKFLRELLLKGNK